MGVKLVNGLVDGNNFVKVLIHFATELTFVSGMLTVKAFCFCS